MSVLLAIYAIGALIWTIIIGVNVWFDGWDPKWSRACNLAFALVWVMLWPLILLWAAYAVLRASWDRRGL